MPTKRCFFKRHDMKYCKGLPFSFYRLLALRNTNVGGESKMLMTSKGSITDPEGGFSSISSVGGYNLRHNSVCKDTSYFSLPSTEKQHKFKKPRVLFITSLNTSY